MIIFLADLIDTQNILISQMLTQSYRDMNTWTRNPVTNSNRTGKNPSYSLRKMYFLQRKAPQNGSTNLVYRRTVGSLTYTYIHRYYVLRMYVLQNFIYFPCGWVGHWVYVAKYVVSWVPSITLCSGMIWYTRDTTTKANKKSLFFRSIHSINTDRYEIPFLQRL